MKNFAFILLAAMGVAFAAPCFSISQGQPTKSRFYNGGYQPQHQKNTLEHKAPVLLGQSLYKGHFIPTRAQLNYPVSVAILVVSPSGIGVPEASIRGFGKYSLEISNNNEKDVECIVTKRVCMDTTNPRSCVNLKQLFLIPIKNKLYYSEHTLASSYTYQNTGTYTTITSLILEGCIDPRYNNIISHTGTYTIT